MIAIHHEENTFSNKWIEYCEVNSIEYKIVDCFDYQIIQQLQDCSALMWHWLHYDYKAKLFVKQLITSLEYRADFKVFPDFRTCWHYDDKVGQKYLLESIDAPYIPTFIFYTQKSAIEWIEKTNFPKIFKTRNGAGSQNVLKIGNKKKAKRVVKKAFSKGIPSYSKLSAIKESYWKLKSDYSFKSVLRVLKYLIKSVLPRRFQPEYVYEKNYVYFQEFIPENTFDIRIIVIGDKAFGIKRLTRDGDFRASGSGKTIYNKQEIPEILIKKTFDLNEKLNCNVLAVDWIIDLKNNEYLLVEISYSFRSSSYFDCPGYWDSNLNWYNGKFTPEYFMIDNLLNEINQ